jgi:hypothetical protein
MIGKKAELVQGQSRVDQREPRHTGEHHAGHPNQHNGDEPGEHRIQATTRR